MRWVIALLLLVPAQAWATVYTVSATPGAADYTNPATCFAALAEGDACEIIDSVNYGAVVLSNNAAGLSIYGAEGQMPTFDGGRATASPMNTTWMPEGFVMHDIAIQGYTGAVCPASRNFTYYDMKVTNCGGYPFIVSSAVSYTLDRVIISGTVGTAAVRQQVVGAVATLTNVVISGGSLDGISASNGTVYCYHCTLTGIGRRALSRSGGGIGFSWGILWNNVTDIYGAVTPVETLQGTDPLFVGSGDNPYLIGAGSPAINNTSTSTETVDLRDWCRDATPDQGAYEYGATGPCGGGGGDPTGVYPGAIYPGGIYP